MASLIVVLRSSAYYAKLPKSNITQCGYYITDYEYRKLYGSSFRLFIGGSL